VSVGLRGWLRGDGSHSGNPGLNPQLQMHRAAIRPAEAKLERMPKMIQSKMGRTPRIGLIQERAVFALV
jgi:hypothetical protein